MMDRGEKLYLHLCFGGHGSRFGNFFDSFEDFLRAFDGNVAGVVQGDGVVGDYIRHFTTNSLRLHDTKHLALSQSVDTRHCDTDFLFPETPIFEDVDD